MGAPFHLLRAAMRRPRPGRVVSRTGRR